MNINARPDSGYSENYYESYDDLTSSSESDSSDEEVYSSEPKIPDKTIDKLINLLPRGERNRVCNLLKTSMTITEKLSSVAEYFNKHELEELEGYLKEKAEENRRQGISNTFTEFKKKVRRREIIFGLFLFLHFATGVATLVLSSYDSNSNANLINKIDLMQNKLLEDFNRFHEKPLELAQVVKEFGSLKLSSFSGSENCRKNRSRNIYDIAINSGSKNLEGKFTILLNELKRVIVPLLKQSRTIEEIESFWNNEVIRPIPIGSEIVPLITGEIAYKNLTLLDNLTVKAYNQCGPIYEIKNTEESGYYNSSMHTVHFWAESPTINYDFKDLKEATIKHLKLKTDKRESFKLYHYSAKDVMNYNKNRSSPRWVVLLDQWIYDISKLDKELQQKFIYETKPVALKDSEWKKICKNLVGRVIA